MKREHKKIRFGLFIVAAVFLCNPLMATIDILPDFIGYLIICASLSGFCEINEYFVEAQRNFYKLLYVSIARFALSTFMILKNFSASETFTLLYLFVFSLLNVIFAMPALLSLKKGLQYLPMYERSKVIDAPLLKKTKISKNEFVYGATVVFLTVHSLLTTLPEFFSLGKYDEYGNINYEALANHGEYRMISFFTLLFAGVIWLAIICVYFGRICKDKKFVNALEKKYHEKADSNENSIFQRDIKKGLGLMLFAFVFSFDIFIDDLNIFPNFISAIFMFFAISYLKDYIKASKGKKICCILACVSALVKWVIENTFIDKFSYTQIAYFEEAQGFYAVLSAANFFDSIMHLLVIFTAISALKDIIKHHTGFSVYKGEDYYNDPKIKELHRGLCKKLKPVYVFAVVRTVTSVFYYIAQMFTEWYFDLAFSYHLIACGIFVLLAADLLKKINDEVSYKYMLA